MTERYLFTSPFSSSSSSSSSSSEMHISGKPYKIKDGDCGDSISYISKSSGLAESLLLHLMRSGCMYNICHSWRRRKFWQLHATLNKLKHRGRETDRQTDVQSPPLSHKIVSDTYSRGLSSPFWISIIDNQWLSFLSWIVIFFSSEIKTTYSRGLSSLHFGSPSSTTRSIRWS